MKQIISVIIVFLLVAVFAVTSINSVAKNSDSSPAPSALPATVDEAPATTVATEKTTVSDKKVIDATVNYLDTVKSESKETNNYGEDDLDLLSRLIYVEVGCDWIPDEVLAKVGSVVLNRVASNLYPNTIYGVIYDPYQYEPDKLYLEEPSLRAKEVALQLLETGSILPPDVLGQNGDGTGDGIYDFYYDETLGSTVYFTYVYS